MKRALYNAQHCDPSVKEYYNKYMSIYRKVIKLAKKKAVRSEIDGAKDSSRAIWKCVNKHRNKKSNTLKEKLMLKVNNKIIDSPQEIVDIFSNQFDYKESSSNGNLDLAMNMLEENCKVYNDMYCRPCNPEEVEKLVKSLENKKSCGYDGLPMTVIKDNIDVLATPLAYFYNECISHGIFPDQLKIARILPVHKKGSKTDPSKYRPISLLPILSKIFEKILKSRLLVHLNMSNVISSRQFGYRRNLGTVDAIDTLINDVVLKLNEKNKVAALFLDLSSAFDFVDHKILLKKLEHYGVRGKTLDLLKSYLQNRKQFVEISTIENASEVLTKSKLINVTRGVPQGSVLGPILFIVFTNDLLDHIDRAMPAAKLVVYADDTNAVVSGNDLETLESNVNSILCAFSTWFSVNNLKINTAKTSALLFKTTARDDETIDIALNGDKVEIASVVKFLGVYIDSSLNWRHELNALESSISSSCYALRSLRDEISEDQLKMVYYALIESKLRYSIKLWGHSYEYNTRKAFVLQKRAIRTIARIPQMESCLPIFKKLGILTVPSLYILVLLSGLAKNIHSIETKEERLIRESTRRKDLPIKFSPHLSVTKHSASYQAIIFFNKLPSTLKTKITKSCFKTELKTFLLKSKGKRNGIVTNPAMRLVNNVKNGLDSAAANIRRTGVALAASAGSNNPAVKSNAFQFQWRRETPL
ncbi:unnamed protein product [Plutella xylostella]|uniref:(diamondback moth) hypothetical protein n=1 Tax=Plutella xylostella TaxID=51655 RepID=A0A8S4G6D8_PLUXY|nr:unnamed protein product [Plutella xylostella]